MNTEKDFPQEKVAEHSTSKDGGVLLSENELEKVSGGMGGSGSTDNTILCPKCSGPRIRYKDCHMFVQCICNRCGYEWTINKYQ